MNNKMIIIIDINQDMAGRMMESLNELSVNHHAIMLGSDCSWWNVDRSRVTFLGDDAPITAESIISIIKNISTKKQVEIIMDTCELSVKLILEIVEKLRKESSCNFYDGGCGCGVFPYEYLHLFKDHIDKYRFLGVGQKKIEIEKTKNYFKDEIISKIFS